MTFKIRETKDFALIAKLNQRIFPSDPLALGFSDVAWVAYLEDMPVGFATLRHLHGEPDSVFFSRAGLQPIAKGYGLHRRLISVRLAYCKREGVKNAVTYTLDDNLTSANNLIACGFKIYEPEYRWADSQEKKEVLYFFKEIPCEN